MDENETKSPPKLFLRFFRWFCHPKMLDYIEGDLLEVYRRRRVQTGKRKADIKFIIDVLLLFRPGIVRPAGGSNHLINYGMFKSYFKIGLRNLLRNKGYSFINMGGLALGITVSMLIGLWTYDEVSFDSDQKNYDRIAQVIQNVTNNSEVQTWKVVPFPMAEELRSNYGSDFKHIVEAVNWGDHMLSIDDKVLKQKGIYFGKEAPEMFGLKAIKGSTNLDEPASILLSASAAEVYFGDDDPLNKIMNIDEMPVVKVVGVYEDFPHNSTFEGLDFIGTWEFLYENSEWMKTIDDPWRPNFTLVFVELNENADIDQVSARIKDAKLKKISPQLAQKKPELFLHPMRDWHLFAEFENGVNVGGAIQYVWMFGIIGVFVLFLACINFMNLSTARHESRAKEVGIRKTVGSLRRQLVLQFFSESFLVVLISFGISLVLAQLSLQLFNEVANKQITILWTNPAFWFASFCFILITAFVAGSYPAFYLSSFRPVGVLKGTFKAGRFSSWPRRVLVVSQFTVSITLIIGTIVVYQQIQFAKDRPVGYSRNNLISIPAMNSEIHDHFEAVKHELSQAGVLSAMAESQSSMTGVWGSTSGLSWEGKDPGLSIDFGVISSSIDYGKTIGWHVKQGRDFSRDFPSDSSAIILNQAAVDFMGLKYPVGAPVTWWDQHLTIIGVIEDMVIASPYEEQQPIIYSLTDRSGNVALIKLNPEVSTREAVNKIEAVFKKYNPSQPFEYQFVDDEYAKKFGNEERIGTLAGFFSALAVIICGLGIFGLASFTAEQRTKEIGIRKVLGASVRRLWQMLSMDFVALVLFACIIAAPLSYYFLDQWLSKYEYRTNITWWVFAVAAVGALIITLLTVSYQAIKAALANPVKSLRSE